MSPEADLTDGRRSGASNLDTCLAGEVRKHMKIEKLLHRDVITGVVLGAVIGLYFPQVLTQLGAIKPFLALLAVYMGLKVVGTIK